MKNMPSKKERLKNLGFREDQGQRKVQDKDLSQERTWRSTGYLGKVINAEEF